VPGEGKTFCNDCDILPTQLRHPEVAEPQPNRSMQDLECYPAFGSSGSSHCDDEGSPLTPPLSRRAREKRAAFTLAEVLITLAIIGVVAAMTIPTLISNYNKKIVETRLLKFYSNMNNAIRLSEIDQGNKKNWHLTNSSNFCADGAYTELCLSNFFNSYIKPYIKYTNAEYKYNGYIVYLIDGSAFKMGYGGHDYYFYPVAQNVQKDNAVIGKDLFIFAFYPNSVDISGFWVPYVNKNGIEPYVFNEWDGTKEWLYENPNSYTKIIQLNNWKIPDDYPLKF